MSKLLVVVVSLVLILGCFVSPAVASEQENLPFIDLDGRYWFSKIGAKLTVGTAGTTINEDTVGIKDENNWEARGTLTFAKNHAIRVSYIKFDYKGTNTLNLNVNFAGRTYNVGSTVTAALDTDYLRAGWIWNFVNREDFKFGSLLEVKGLFANFTLADNLKAHKYSFELYVPTVGAVTTYMPHKMFGVFAEASGMYVGKYGYLIDTEAGLKVVPHKNLQLQGGYRLLDIKGKSDSDVVNLKFYGPFVGLTLHF